MIRWILSIAALASCASGQGRPVDLASFDQIWTTIRDTHWQAKPGGLDWDAVRAELRPRVEKAASPEAARGVMQEMIGRLKQTHFAIFPSVVYSSLSEEIGGPGSPGIDLRVLNNEAVVTSIDSDSPAERTGVKLGWAIRAVNGRDWKPLIEAGKNTSTLQLTRSLLSRLSGPEGGSLDVTFDTGGATSTLRIGLAVGRGTLAEFGNLPATRVWYEDRRIGSAVYVRFNVFLDIPRLIPAFERSLKNCGDCSGVIIDLRGNPGGIGGMAMGMAGFLVNQPNQRLGTMYMKGATLNFVINPRPNVFVGPVAILIDGTSASTSEILAGGLKDLDRARVFGTRSAAAALPSVFTRLPNGDGFQYAVANYISQGGQTLEGSGVSPDEAVQLTREGLLRGHDAVVDAALAWIEKARK